MNAVAYRYTATPATAIRVDASATDWQWAVQFSNAVGTDTACTILLATRGSGAFRVYSSGFGGSCSVTVTRAAPNLGDETEGTFSGVLGVAIGGTDATPPIAVTNGRFRAPRVADHSP